jgi:hypothetical protein
MEPLIGRLTDRKCNAMASKSLQTMGWTPQTKEERIHFLIAMSDPTIKEAKNWQDVKTVLMQDAISGDADRTAFALKAFTHIGNESILPELLQLIKNRGTLTIAESFLNCGRKELNEAAHDWARSHGYSIQPTSLGGETWEWGR